MRMSLLTNSLTGVGIRDLKTIADWAWENGICELDVGPAIPLDKEQFDAVLGEGKVSVGTMIYCRNFLSRDKEEAEFHCSALRDRIRFAGEMGIEKIVCSTGVTAESFGGMGFAPEKSLPAVVELAKQFVELAEKYGVKLCYENCPMMGNIATSPDLWKAVFDAVGSEQLGLCYDPSHLSGSSLIHIKTSISLPTGFSMSMPRTPSWIGRHWHKPAFYRMGNGGDTACRGWENWIGAGLWMLFTRSGMRGPSASSTRIRSGKARRIR